MNGLLELLDGEFGEAVEYDILRHGRRLQDLGTAAFPWRELLLIVRHQDPHESALRRAALDHVDFGYSDQVQVAILNTLRVMSWQLGMDPDAPRPERVLMPGEKSDEQIDAMSIEDMDARLAQMGLPPMK
jgi:hypothetical protein